MAPAHKRSNTFGLIPSQSSRVELPDTDEEDNGQTETWHEDTVRHVTSSTGPGHITRRPLQTTFTTLVEQHLSSRAPLLPFTSNTYREIHPLATSSGPSATHPGYEDEDECLDGVLIIDIDEFVASNESKEKRVRSLHYSFLRYLTLFFHCRQRPF